MRRFGKGLLVFGALAGTAGDAAPASGQSSASGDRFGYELSVGVAPSYPAEFDSRSCSSAVAVEGGLLGALRLSSRVVTETSATLSFSLGPTCDSGDAIFIVDGTFTRSIFDEDIKADPFLTTAQRVVLEPWTADRRGLRLSLGGGRFWGKGVWFWSAGAGVRLWDGRTSPIVEVERMAFGLGFVEETTLWESGVPLQQSTSARQEVGRSLWVVRVRLAGF